VVSNFLYVVRVLPKFRFASPYEFDEDTPSGPPSIVAAFRDMESVHKFTSESTPIHINPFLESFGDEDEEGEEMLMVYFFDSAEDDDIEVSLKELENYIRLIGLTPPLAHDESDWSVVYSRWWDEQADTMTPEQKVTLWRFLIPQPYEILEVELEV
jgi:hypothetical protein